MVAAACSTGPRAVGPVQMRPHWWGILGLIGWAYLVATLTYLLVRGNPGLLLGASAGLFAFTSPRGGWLGRLANAAVRQRRPDAGVTRRAGPARRLHGRMFLPDAPHRTPAARAAWGVVCAAASSRRVAAPPPTRSGPCLIINKILATPPCACTRPPSPPPAWSRCRCWSTDRRPRWAACQTRGRNALLAYILAPVVYALFGLIANLTATENLLQQLRSPFALGLTVRSRWRSSSPASRPGSAGAGSPQALTPLAVRSRALATRAHQSRGWITNGPWSPWPGSRSAPSASSRVIADRRAAQVADVESTSVYEPS